ncbi:MAG TPA: beta-galactosidase, partial [Chitinophagaceae bacterium]
NHPLFREALKKFILAYGAAFKDHPAVTGWQLDNEIEWNILRVDFNPANRKAWTEWLKKKYHSKDELNSRLGLNAWGLQTDAIEDVPQPSKSNDGGLPALYLANLHFDRDNIMEYFHWQKSLLRKSGVQQWITTDYVMIYDTIADQPKENNPIDIPGINQYQPTEDDPEYWASQAMFNNIHRCINDNGRFLVTETRIGPTGNVKIENPAPSKQQFFMWMLEPAAFGANGIMHWSGNRFAGGHWPHWGGMLDWSGHPEPDFQWAAEIAAFYKKWGGNIISNTVDAKAAVLTDFDQRAALEIYPHATGSDKLLADAFEAFHRNGIGVDAINSASARSYENLKKYQLLVIAAAPCLDGGKLYPALKQFVENGGTLIITPFTGYQTWDGIFRKTGFASDLTGLMGSLVRTVRLIGQPSDKNDKKNAAVWKGDYPLDASEIGMDGFTEILEIHADVKVIAHFSTNEEVINNGPAATLKKTGKGNTIKLAFWPAQNNFAQLIRHITQKTNPYLKGSLPIGVQGVPRTDNSFFIINTLNQPTNVSLIRPMTDRITGTT